MRPHLPIFRDEDEANAAYIACGKLAIYWGHVELAMESIILILRNRQRAPVVGRAFVDFPVSFSKKKREIKARMKSDPLFADQRNQTSATLANATAAHEVRVIVMHSICQGTNLKGDLMFGHSDQKRGVSYTPKTLSLKRINAASDLMLALQVDLAAMFSEMQRRWLAPGAPPYVPASPRNHPLAVRE